jgi:predicted transcriptional regulator
LHAAEDAQREAILAAKAAGASLRRIATEAGLSHEQVRRIVQGDSVAPYFVTVERRGVSPLQVQLLVQAPSKRAAGELASWIAERNRDGIFEATKIRRAPKKVSAFPASSFDDADL